METSTPSAAMPAALIVFESWTTFQISASLFLWLMLISSPESTFMIVESCAPPITWSVRILLPLTYVMVSPDTVRPIILPDICVTILTSADALPAMASRPNTIPTIRTRIASTPPRENTAHREPDAPNTRRAGRVTLALEV